MTTAGPNDLAQALRAFFADHLPRVRGTSPHTIRSYRDSLVLLLRFAATRTQRSVIELDLDDLGPQPILAFLEYLEHDRHNSVATRNVRLTAIHAFFRYCAMEHPARIAHCQRVLAVPFKRTGSRPVEYLEHEEVEAVLGVVDRGTVDGRRDYALLATLFNVVTAGYLETMQIPLVDGRPFTAGEIDEGRQVVLLSDGLARRIWPDGARVGRRVRLVREAGAQEPWLTVVGITRDVVPPAQVLGLDTVPTDQLYLPYGAQPTPLMTLAVRTRSDALGAVATLRTELQGLDETVPVYNVLTMPQVLEVVHWVAAPVEPDVLGVRRAGARDVGNGCLRRDGLRRQPAPA